jgi:dTMP kinase
MSAGMAEVEQILFLSPRLLRPLRSWAYWAASPLIADSRSRASAKYQAVIYDFLVSPHHHRGRFITFEGLDGCGKSTQLEKLAGVFQGQGLSVVVTREPGGTASGEKMRRLLLDIATAGLSPMAELALMFASRAQHIAEVIQPALAAGSIVLCDRFTDSTEAYQGGGRKLGSQPVLSLHHILCGDLQPDLTILMDSEVATSVERARRRNKKHSAGNGHGKSDENRFEQESRAFFGRVRSTYLAIAAREPLRVVVVDARGTAHETHARIVEIARRKLRLPAKTAYGSY